VVITSSVANLAIKNQGPGNAWFSMTDGVVYPGGPFSTVLAAGESYHESHKIGNVTMTAQGDAASVCLNL
jgi:hypothetical protein